jgi:SpoVK/Ycf46/Vps4 family AAA+-type ATPase
MRRKRETTKELQEKKKIKKNIVGILEPPKNITTIKDIIKFIYTYNGEYVNTDKLYNIIEPLIELDNMIGLTSCKRMVLDMIMYFSQNRHIKNTDYLHMVVSGPPGCGKTTFCKIMGKILSGLSILPKDTFIKIKRTDLIAKYLGQTAHKTENILQKCIGGVIFIDEAYSLAPKDNEKDSFSKEAIDYLNEFLSEHKDDVCCIIAGYEDELQNTFFSMNEGLKRRFPWKFIIEPYKGLELFEIFKNMLEKINYNIEENSIDKQFFEINKDVFNFYGGDIETFITKCKFIHTRNTFGEKINNILTRKDINEALIEHKKYKNIKLQDVPFNMYI